MSDRYNISAVQGSTLLLNINVRDSSNNLINLSGYSARSFVRSNYSSTGVMLNLNPQIHPSYVSGLITLSGRQSDLANMPCGVWVYDVECSGANEYVFKPVRGYFAVDPEATY